jgi:predicted transcriptional regulator
MVGELLDRLFARDPAALVSHLVSDGDVDEAEIERLLELLESAEATESYEKKRA